MAWVRIHDGAMTHPKIIGLSDKAFRLWIWGLSYSQQHLTNGAIPSVAIPSRMVRATADLVTANLWDASASGYQVHDYLDWNDSRDVVLKKRTDAKDRMQAARDRRSTPRLADRLQESSHERSANVLERTSHEVLRRVGLSSSSSEKEETSIPTTGLIVTDELGERAARFLETYADLYRKHRHGAKLLRQRPALDWDKSCQLCHTWDDARLSKMAVILLTTDDDWISGTDRGFGVFFTKASWCDERLSAWEAKRKPA